VQHKSHSSIGDEFERALGAIRTRVSVSSQRLAIAYSGGLDSAVLLHLAHAYAQANGLSLFAFHVHHGLSPNADTWLAHCQDQCTRLGVSFDARHVAIDDAEKNGIEEAARLHRYAALGEMCRAYDVPLLLTAHHQDDQAETVLLQLLRGSGVAGLSGMDESNHAPDLLGDAQLLMGRPLLHVSRTALAAHVDTCGIAYVEDESNTDPRYARNALRRHVMPLLQQYFPGYQSRFARSAAHAQSAQRLLIELACQDLSACLEGERLNVQRMRQFDDERIDNLLRYWFASRGVRMPSTSWLREMRTQLLEAKQDAQLCVTHADCEIRRHREHVFMTHLRDQASAPVPENFAWEGQASLHWPQFGGTLYFDAGEHGVDAEWLSGQRLSIRLRSGGERLKPAANRPTRSLKQHYQSLGVPAWERERLPLVLADEEVLFAAGIGMDSHCLSAGAGQKIVLRWEFDPT
jgi:tRNA(Ile)-lysidine synthase